MLGLFGYRPYVTCHGACAGLANLQPFSATLHGFRSTFRTWGQNETSIEREVLEYCLHHIEGGEAELAYARGDVWEKRKAALKEWETVCNSKAAPKLKLVA